MLNKSCYFHVNIIQLIQYMYLEIFGGVIMGTIVNVISTISSTVVSVTGTVAGCVVKVASTIVNGIPH